MSEGVVSKFILKILFKVLSRALAKNLDSFGYEAVARVVGSQ